MFTQVIAYENWLLEDVKKCIEIVFQKLYPSEQTLKVCKLQNEFHFDLPHHYTVGDTLTDAGLLFAIEEEHNPTDRYINDQLCKRYKNKTLPTPVRNFSHGGRVGELCSVTG